MLGDGKDIAAFTDPWLSLKGGFCEDPDQLSNNRQAKVSDYLLSNEKS